MNYKDFLEFKEIVLKENNSLINLAENNLYETLKEFKPKDLSLQERPYRCHTAEDFLKRYNLNEEWKEYLSITKGVRHSLVKLFSVLNNWIIPEDQYPFYQEELKKSQSSFKEYKSLCTELDLKENGVLLITYPKKLGEYSGNEINSLRNWLKSDNLLVVDLVYWLSDYLPEEILELYKTNKVIILYSFSKKLLIPNHVGFNLLPQNELGKSLSKELNSLDKDEERLKIARSLLREDKFSPAIKKELINRFKELRKLGFDFKFNEENPSYLFYHEDPPETFLKKGMLVIPESVFGGKGTGSIISSL